LCLQLLFPSDYLRLSRSLESLGLFRGVIFNLFRRLRELPLVLLRDFLGFRRASFQGFALRRQRAFTRLF
jgi:hypothetical protein